MRRPDDPLHYKDLIHVNNRLKQQHSDMVYVVSLIKKLAVFAAIYPIVIFIVLKLVFSLL